MSYLTKKYKEKFLPPGHRVILTVPTLCFLGCSTAIAALCSTGLLSDSCNRDQFTAKAKDEPEGNHTEKSDPWENHIDLEDHWFSVIFLFCFVFLFTKQPNP